MKELTRCSRTAGYLEKIFRALNTKYFDGELAEPVITIQSTPRAYGHVTVGKVWGVKDTTRHELNIGAGTLNRPIEETVATMLHEMVHLYCLAHDIQDTSRGNAYHNKRFKAEGEKRALHLEYDKRIGWSVTSPTPELCDFIIEQGWTDINMSRHEFLSINIGGGNKGKDGNADTDDGAEKKKSSTRKYKCPCCGNSVRATKQVNIICGDCMERMEVVEK